jgi:NADH dehydrogenase/NADH:ubiquinone oxidoreductase subunit G
MQKMITLTIDNKKVEVEEGSTVLQAAEKLGMRAVYVWLN